MPRYIDADAHYQEIDAWRENLTDTYGENDEYCKCLERVLDIIENAPTADVVERKKGKWVGKPIAGYATVRCSACNNVFRENSGRWSFCPNCGAETEILGKSE